ncbi:ATP-binding cassette subfamily B protein/ATP-binding cassette subfamily C protein/ATP-binding cassette subfamily B multidrug efflux pump [Pseudomonas duriflava]|uniref:ATP-binding cassette subfamily B protein/ATP-binding cassette subfamily C protein/ATP-binding cassette subfamily B multidrug efflux pump n=1 Tax=Pseudomonas duriflava TaxID=459528 RepID=A0A562QC27_9PSED|nr:ABC transporter transmembrane domain-containing protein [Pseudomonas duriflava]TWI54263.1 ATP-binding cassette subfamily B protein/ATP-binding cassette subfamily C protein/ATP-binding cassette subfamily B multidrug efflux pump [Pseudomonas duriflava]
MLERRVFKLLLGPVFANPRRLAVTVAILIGATTLDVAGPWLTKHYLDTYLVPGDLRAQPLVTLLLIYIATQALAATGHYIQSLRFAGIAMDTVLLLRRRLFRHVLHLPQSFHDRTATGELVARVTNDTDALRELYVAFLGTVVGNIVLLAGILIAMALMDIHLMAIAALLIPAAAFIVWLYQRLSGPAAMRVRALRAEQSARLNEAIGGMGIIQAFNQTRAFREHFHTLNQAQYEARISTVRLSGLLLRSALDLISVAVLAVLLLSYGMDHLLGGAEIGVLYAFITYLGRVTEPLMEITQRFNLYQQATVAGARLLHVLDQHQVSQGTDDRPVEKACFELEQVRFRHEAAEHDTLSDIDLTIAPGTFLAIVGPTGSGKSTLLDLLAGLQPISGGRLLLDGRELSSLTPDVLGAAIASVPQEPFVRSSTLRDNLLLGSKVDPQQLKEALDDAHLSPLVARLPEGLETRLGERGFTLSTGERQLLALARALLRKPKVLLLDEATASIDSETETLLQEALHDLRGRVTMIVVAHRLSTIREADRILVLRQGRIVEDGSHEQLLTHPEGHYYHLWHQRRDETTLSEKRDAHQVVSK